LPSGGCFGPALTAVGEGFLAQRFVAGDSVCLLGVVSFWALERGAAGFFVFWGGAPLLLQSGRSAWRDMLEEVVRLGWFASGFLASPPLGGEPPVGRFSL